MRHGKKFNHLGRKKGHRASMLANMACSLIKHKRINTTLAKAKALKQFIEPIITKSKSEIKEDNTPVTNGDLEVNKLLINKISELTPDILIVSEETPLNKNLSIHLLDIH